MKPIAEEICRQFNITDDDLKQICKRYLVKEGYDFRKFWINCIEFEDFSKTVLGYLGYHLKLTVNVSPKSVIFEDELNDEKSDDESEDKNLTFFVKLFPKANQKQSDYVEQMRIFEKETQLFEFLIPRLQDIAIGAKEWAAQSYLCKDDKVLIVEDLRLEGFQTPINLRNGILDLDHLTVATTVLGRFHASSIILEARSRDTVTNLYPDCLYETSYPEDPSHIRTFGRQNAILALLALIRQIPKYQCDYLAMELIEAKLPELVHKIVDFVKPSGKFRNVFCHGDLWANNLLFMYEEISDLSDESDESNTESCNGDVDDEEEGLSNDISVVMKTLDKDLKLEKEKLTNNRFLKPIDGRLVDFQLARYCPPALDLLTLITLTTTLDFRHRYLVDLCKNYYHSLRTELDRLEIDVNEEVPLSEFWKSIEHYRMAGLIECLLFSQLTLLPEEMTQNLLDNSENFGEFLETEKRVQLCLQSFEKDVNYRTRMTEMLCQFVDEYILEVTAL